MTASPVKMLGKEGFAELIRQVRDEGSCYLEIPDGDGGRVQLAGEREAGAVSLVITNQDGHDPTTLMIFDAANTRPTAYPKDLPYIPNVPVTLTLTGWDRSVLWEVDGSPQTLLEAVVKQSEASGWRRRPGGRLPVILTMGELSRSVVHMPIGPLKDKVILLEQYKQKTRGGAPTARSRR